MKTFISLLLALYSTQSFAAASCAEPSKKTSGLKAVCDRLEPKCIEDGGDDSQNPEKSIAKLTGESSDDELFTRLIFAESIASTCVPGKSDDDIMEGIAWTLKNRVDSKNAKDFGIGRGVVTHTQQFRSSTGFCDVAKRKEFLCPQKLGPKWHETWEKASLAWSKTKTSENPLRGVKNYFFPTHFDKSKKPSCAKWKGVLPKWSKKENTVKEIPNCATFHNLKN